MFGKLLNNFKHIGTITEVKFILSNTYSLDVSLPAQKEMLLRVVENFGQTLNFHELAIQFLADFSKTILKGHPRANSEIEKYIRFSKGAYLRGLATNERPQQELFEVAQKQFGIDSNSIVSA